MNYLKIVIDTSVLFSIKPKSLINSALCKLIEEESNNNEIDIQWFLPEIVYKERKFQLFLEAQNLFKSTKKLFDLININKVISIDEIKNRLEKLLDNSIKTNKLKIIKLDYSKVNWQEIVEKSVNRLPPFDPGENEKGFRDAIVIESYFQLLSETQNISNPCYVILATNDELQIESVKKRIVNLKNKYSPLNIDGIKGFINSLKSRIEIEITEKVRELAKNYFFSHESTESLFIDKKIQNTIEINFFKILNELPDGANKRINSNWYVEDPQFLNKNDSRWAWISKISVGFKTFKNISKIQPINYSNYGSSGSVIPTESSSGSAVFYTPSLITSGSAIENAYNGGSVLIPGGSFYDEVLFAVGKNDFEIKWSIEVDKNFIISDPKIEDIKFIEGE